MSRLPFNVDGGRQPQHQEARGEGAGAVEASNNQGEGETVEEGGAGVSRFAAQMAFNLQIVAHLLEESNANQASKKRKTTIVCSLANGVQALNKN